LTRYDPDALGRSAGVFICFSGWRRFGAGLSYLAKSNAKHFRTLAVAGCFTSCAAREEFFLRARAILLYVIVEYKTNRSHRPSHYARSGIPSFGGTFRVGKREVAGYGLTFGDFLSLSSLPTTVSLFSGFASVAGSR